MKREVIIEYDADRGLTIPVNLSMPVANNVVGELIRCKDCKWHNTDKDECWLSGLDTDGYEYCSWAERKEK